MSDYIDRQAAIAEIVKRLGIRDESYLTAQEKSVVQVLRDMPSAQPEITDEQAIEHLQSTGWMQNHDKQMYEMGLKENLADDSGSYDSLIPSAQPESKREWYMKGYRDAQDVALQESCTDCPLYDHDKHNCPRFNRVIPATIEEVKPMWIPVTERLPEEHEWMGTKRFGTTISDEVYVTFENPKGERFCKHLSFQNGKLSDFDQSTIDAFYKGSKPIAWMPLPPSYRENEDE